jgi:hypothetical protein
MRVIAKASPRASPDPDDAVHVDAVHRHFLDRDDVRLRRQMGAGVDHLGEAAALGLHQHVGQQQRERLATDELARAPHRVPEADRPQPPQAGPEEESVRNVADGRLSS